MSRPKNNEGKKNIISNQLKSLRNEHGLSQRDLARELQLCGVDMDKNVITRIETNQRYVADFELKAIAEYFNVPYGFLLDNE